MQFGICSYTCTTVITACVAIIIFSSKKNKRGRREEGGGRRRKDMLELPEAVHYSPVSMLETEIALPYCYLVLHEKSHIPVCYRESHPSRSSSLFSPPILLSFSPPLLLSYSPRLRLVSCSSPPPPTLTSSLS